MNLGLMLFNTFMGNLEDVTECALSKFAGGTKLGGAADMPNGGALIQRHLEKVEADASFSNEKHESCIWGGITSCISTGRELTG